MRATSALHTLTFSLTPFLVFQPVAIAADRFIPAALAFRRDDLRYHIVEKSAVMTDEEQCARVIL